MYDMLYIFSLMKLTKSKDWYYKSYLKLMRLYDGLFV